MRLDGSDLCTNCHKRPQWKGSKQAVKNGWCHECWCNWMDDEQRKMSAPEGIPCAGELDFL